MNQRSVVWLGLEFYPDLLWNLKICIVNHNVDKYIGILHIL
jgi:hypothetical protein